MKVVVFAGKFNPEDTSLVSITFHNMRRAHVTAPLGPVPKVSLTRGLTFPAIRPGKRLHAVLSLKGTALYLCIVMWL